MAKRAKGHKLFSKRGRTAKSMRTVFKTQKPGGPRVLSSQDSAAVGRPGYRGYLGGMLDGKKRIRRVMRNDPAVGVTQPQANAITSTHVDIVGPQSPNIVNAPLVGAPNAGKKVIRTPRLSRPVFTNKPGKVSRGPR